MAGRGGKSADDKAWDHFVDWCLKRRLAPLPANAWSIAAYLRHLDSIYTPVEIAKNLKSISRMHALKSRHRPDRDPMVARAMQLIEVRANSQNTAPTLFNDDDFISDAPPPSPKVRQKLNVEPEPAPKIKRLSSNPRLVQRRNLKT